MLIRTRDLTRVYSVGEGSVQALRGVSLDVERGEYVAVMGPSGSGKSTLMHLIGCLDRPTSGSYWLDDVAVEGLSDTELSSLRNRRIGFVFQSFNLLPQLSVLENVEVPLVYRGLSRSERTPLAADVLASVGLAERIRHKPTELSGGECQRVAIARALVMDPDILLADEPTGNLDSRTGDEIMEALARLHADGRTILLVTHDLARASAAERLIEMRDGRITRETRGESVLQLLEARSSGALLPAEGA